jgi:hypothetical protein
MPLKKIIFKPGVNRENTRYTTEGGWYDCDKVRFRQGTPEKIGGWSPALSGTFLGVCRSLWNWVTLASINVVGVGTNLKFYLSEEAYYDITPERYQTTTTRSLTNALATTNTSAVVTVTDSGINLNTGDVVVLSGISTAISGIPADELNGRHVVTRVDANSYTITVTTPANATASSLGGTFTADYFYYVVALVNPYTTTTGSNVVTVTDVAHGCVNGDFVTITPSVTLNGVSIPTGEYQITVLNSLDTYTIVGTGNASSSGSGGGTVYFRYQINVGPEIEVPLIGWGAGSWGENAWGASVVSGVSQLRIWSQANYGQDLVFGPRNGGLYYWDATTGLNTRGVAVETLAGASDVPVVQNTTLVSDISRFVLSFGCNDYGSNILDPMLIRWSDQESVTNWTPEATNQAGSLRLSQGSRILTALQVRQEVLVWTDSSLYSLQYLGPPYVWGANILGDNLSLVGPNAKAVASGVAYWMGRDKFYSYNGRVNTLRCDLREYIFSDINFDQSYQICSGTNEGFNEVWWFYPSANSTVNDKYVIYNYLEDTWYYGTIGRTAWLDSGIRAYPVAATYSNTLVNHESGVNDDVNGNALPINAYIQSSQFDIDDGHNFGFIWRMIPDITFRNSVVIPGYPTPQVTMTLTPYQNSGSGANSPASVGGSSSAPVTRIAQVPVEEFTGQVYIRVRGRQLAFKIESNQLGTQWQLGAPRIDIKQDGRR